jgi:hypothetical protein
MQLFETVRTYMHTVLTASYYAPSEKKNAA